LSFGKECLWIRTLTAELEVAEIFIPFSFWHIGLGFDPYSECVQIIRSYLTIQEALADMSAESWRELTPAM